MTGTASRAAPGPRQASGPVRLVRAVARGGVAFLRRLDAALLLSILVVLLVGIPSVLIFQPLGGAGTPANMVGMMLLLWWIASRLVPRFGVSTKGQPVRVAVSILFAAVLLSYGSAMLHGWGMPIGLQERTAFGSGSLQLDTVAQVTAKEIKAADRGLLSLAAWAGIALVAADGISTRRRLDLVLHTLTAMGAFMAFLGALQYFFAVDIASYFTIPGLHPNGDFGGIAFRSVRRVQSTAMHPIEFGVVLSAILPIAISRAMYSPPGKRWLPWTYAMIIALAIPMSVSRSAILAFGVAAVILFLGWNGRQQIAGFVVFCFFGIAMKVLVHGLLGTVRSLFINLGNDPSIQGRTRDYAVVSQLFHERPLLGRGFFTFIPVLYRTFDNAYLLALVELGAIGLVALILVFLIGILTARGARRAAPDARGRDLGQALAAAIAAIAVSAATFDMLSFPMAATLSFLLLGCSGALWRLHRQDLGLRARPAAAVPLERELQAVRS
ncbi:MAG TPA: O-antigen ligase family protein [Mycobacteriales bacterium]|nr:O-antigen ligase family protein [Mycobacteriales bacterium]